MVKTWILNRSTFARQVLKLSRRLNHAKTIDDSAVISGRDDSEVSGQAD
jgi:hypothetical protein